MKTLLTLLILTLATSLYSQFNPLPSKQFISCPLSLTFEKDSSQMFWGLLTTVPSDWSTIALATPQENSKEGWTYGNWYPTNCKAEPTTEFFISVVATRQRFNISSGEVQMQSYTCIYSLKDIKPKKK